LPGFNFKCSDVLAAVALVQLSQAEEKIRRVREVYMRYAAAIQELPFLEMVPVNTAAGELPLYVQALCPRRDELMQFLQGEGIQTRKSPPDLSHAPYLAQDAAMRKTRFGDEGVVLPCGPDQPLTNVERVIDALRRFGQLLGETAVTLYGLHEIAHNLPAATS
jgi:dTDP-4-amino-4,6-dideoxygalactose transaminase